MLARMGLGVNESCAGVRYFTFAVWGLTFESKVDEVHQVSIRKSIEKAPLVGDAFVRENRALKKLSYASTNPNSVNISMSDSGIMNKSPSW
jgi:hypothetical protein